MNCSSAISIRATIDRRSQDKMTESVRRLPDAFYLPAVFIHESRSVTVRFKTILPSL